MTLFYDSLYVRGYRPLIGWIVGVSLFLLYPTQILLSYINSVFKLGIIIDVSLLDKLSVPIITLTVSIIGIRSFEKLKGLKHDDTHINEK